MQAEAVVAFWRDAGSELWFAKGAVFDAEFRARFLAVHERAVRRELDDWASKAESALALLLLLDQIPRNAFRGTARMYATDASARAIAERALDAGFDRQVDAELRVFSYLPFAHSESLADQDRSVELNRSLGEESLRYALGHREIICCFGHFPHRNALLGRQSTPEEEAFLRSGGFTG